MNEFWFVEMVLMNSDLFKTLHLPDLESFLVLNHRELIDPLAYISKPELLVESSF